MRSSFCFAVSVTQGYGSVVERMVVSSLETQVLPKRVAFSFRTSELRVGIVYMPLAYMPLNTIVTFSLDLPKG